MGESVVNRNTPSHARKPARPANGWAPFPPRIRYRSALSLLVAALLTPRRLVHAVLVVSVGTTGVLSATSGHRSPTQVVPAGPAVTRRPLPDGVSEREVPKWVPIRQVSGRVELDPWTSVDADRARSQAVRDELFGKAHPSTDVLAPRASSDERDRRLQAKIDALCRQAVAREPNVTKPPASGQNRPVSQGSTAATTGALAASADAAAGSSDAS